MQGYFLKSTLATAIYCAISGLAVAQDDTDKVVAQDDNYGTVLEEVIVTATRRAQTVQEVPYNISAILGDDLERQGITDTAELFRVIPGAEFFDLGPRSSISNTNLVLRGINAEDVIRISGLSQTAPVVSTYINETPIFVNLRLRDIERIEVLRGPQGTLYGASSLGGSVRYLYNKPDLDGYSADFRGGIGQTAHAGDMNYEADVVVNFPLGDQFAVRAYAGYENSAGFIDKPAQYVLRSDNTPDLDNGSTDPIGDAANFFVGQPVYESKEDVNDAKTKAFRVALLWQPTERFEALLSYHYQDDKSGGPQFNSPFAFGYDSVKNATLIDEPFERDVNLTALEIMWEMDFAILTASASHYKTKGNGQRDITGGFDELDFYTEFYGSSPRPLLEAVQEFTDKGTVFEARLASNLEGSLDWLIGVYHMDQDREQLEDQWFWGYDDYATSCFITTDTFGGDPCGFGTLYGLPEFDPNGPIPVEKDLMFVVNQFTKFKETAVFGELTWHISDRWQITGGARWFDQKFTNNTVTGEMFIPDTGISVTSSNQGDDVIFKFNTSFDINDYTMVYATWAEGFRRGGANALPEYAFGFIPTDPALFQYDPDKTKNFEIGIKGEFAERWRYSAAAYTIDWDKMQVNSACTPAAYLCAFNAGDARTKGVELELWGRPMDNLDLNIGYSYIDAKLRTLADNLPDLIESGQIFYDVEPGSELPGVPKNTLYAGALYTQPLSNGMDLVWGVNGSYRGAAESSLDVTSVRVDSFWLWDASLTLNRDKWYVRAFIDNIADERGLLSADSVEFFGIGANALVSTPRTVGLVFGYWIY